MGDSKPTFLARLFPNLHWRWTCPDNIDDIASDFIGNRNTYSLDDWPIALAHDGGFALRRRISAVHLVSGQSTLWRGYPHVDFDESFANILLQFTLGEQHSQSSRI